MQFDSFKIIGMEKIDSNYLKRVLTFAERTNSYFEPEQTLRNVIGIVDVQKVGDTKFKIIENKTFLPVIKFGGIKDNNWFQLGFQDLNLFGKGHQLSAYYQYSDKRHSTFAFYKIPYLKNPNWGWVGSFLSWRSVEPLNFPSGSFDYNYDNNAIYLGLIRNFGFRKSLEFGSSLFREIYEKRTEQSNPDTPEELPVLVREDKSLQKLELILDNRNFHIFYLDGIYLRSTLQQVITFSDQSLFHSFQVESTYFRRIRNKGNFALRVLGGIATNNDSPFAPFVADSHFNIRGIGNRIDRGTAQLILSIEYRQTVLDKGNFAFQMIAFADNGSWRNPGGEVKDLFDSSSFQHFVGGGARIIYKKFFNAILRLDYGVNIRNADQRGFVLGIGQYF